MNRTTTGLCVAALLVSCNMNSVLRADGLVMGDNFFVTDGARHQWVNEHNHRTGMLTVSGALLSSPCTLETNEVELPLHKSMEGIMTRYALTLSLLGCGDGGAVTSADSVAGHDRMMVMQSALLTGGDGVLQPEQRMVSAGRVVLYGGVNHFTYWLSEAQQQAVAGQPETVPSRDNPALLRLQVGYE
ncbi:pilus-assembly fibrillin subunit [Escherichia coli]|uniref:pilus-assembly fibrillin subunit n=1 Tax=Escherichia coli TaxID=562 RepID=UPI0010CFE6A8|nr:pilus-assembly fibrillin subunit [Escherichia coli]GDM19304.1 fimbrial protein PapJ [Escherichia coli]